MVDKKWSKYETGQRVELTDAKQAARGSHLDTMEAIVTDVLVGSSSSAQSFILEGFGASETAGVLTVNRGVAVLGYQLSGQTRLGMVLSGGDATKTVDMTSLADGTYQVYVRFEFDEEDFANRFFWNPLAATPVETSRNIATRFSDSWSITLASTSPGPEWSEIAEVGISGGGTSFAVTDTRRLMFDTLTGEITDTEWGAAADRSGTVRGVRDAIMALARQVQDIIGDTDWKQDPATGVATGPFLRRDNSNDMLSGSAPQLRVNNSSAGADAGIILNGSEAAFDNWLTINNSPNSGPGGTTAEAEIDVGAGAGRLILDAEEVRITGSLIQQGGLTSRRKMYSPADAAFTQTSAGSIYLDRGIIQSAVEDVVLLQCNATSDPQRFWIPIHLPQNALITGGAVRFGTNSNANIRAGIGRLDPAADVRVSLRSGAPDFDTITVTTFQALTINESLAVRTVDNEQYTYYFFCYIPDGVPFFSGAYVDYDF